MTHFPVAVILPGVVDPVFTDGLEHVEDVTASLMAPYQETAEWFEDGTRWDWYVIGGRWDGEILGLPWEPHYEPCDLCDGTGIRPRGLEEFGPAWFEQTKGCNGCSGTGQKEIWPTDPRYQDPDRNIVRMSRVSLDYTPTAFVKPTGEWVEQTRVGFWGMDIPDENGLTKAEKVAGFDQQWANARQAYGDHWVVSLDCHV